MAVAGRQHHRVGQAALLGQPVFGLFGEFGDRMPGEEFRGDPAPRRFLGYCLGAVLAELGELASAMFLWPRATRAVETVPLIDPGQCLGGAQRTHLPEPALHADHHGLDPGGFVFGAGHRYVVFVVGGVDIVAVSDGGHLSNLIREIWDSGPE